MMYCWGWFMDLLYSLSTSKSHFRHLQTHKPKLELVLRIMRVINIYRAGIENVQEWKDKICTFLCYRGWVREFAIQGSTKEISPPQSQGEAAARKAACCWSRALLPSPMPAKLRQGRSSHIISSKSKNLGIPKNHNILSCRDLHYYWIIVIFVIDDHYYKWRVIDPSTLTPRWKHSLNTCLDGDQICFHGST